MAVIGKPLVNGVAYTHADIVFNLFGVPIIGVTAVSYSDKQAITANYSTGQKATSVGFGQITYTASITVSMECMEAIQAAAAANLPDGRIQNIPFFDLGINFLPEGGGLKRHVLKRCRFTGRDQSSTTGNSQIEVTLELFVADINYNGLSS